jgi:copper chaperone CopZ
VGVTEVVETIPISGFRCERCAVRLGTVLEGHPGLLSARGNLLGEITFSYDDELTTREELVAAMARGGFYVVTTPAFAE